MIRRSSILAEAKREMSAEYFFRNGIGSKGELSACLTRSISLPQFASPLASSRPSLPALHSATYLTHHAHLPSPFTSHIFYPSPREESRINTPFHKKAFGTRLSPR